VINTPAVVTEQGDIRLHNREGARLPLYFQNEDGGPRDMTNAVVTFMTSAGFSKALTPGIEPNELLLVLEPLELADHLNAKAEFIVQDESMPECPVIWQGHMMVTGW
jgi:hypothetical protein